MSAQLHVLKTWPPFYEDMRDGKKTFEYRKNDRAFKVGDFLVLYRWNPDALNPDTDMCIYVLEHGALTFQVTYIVEKAPGLPEGYCVMQLQRCGDG